MTISVGAVRFEAAEFAIDGLINDTLSRFQAHNTHHEALLISALTYFCCGNYDKHVIVITTTKIY